MDPLTIDELVYQAWLYNISIEDTLAGLQCNGYMTNKYEIIHTWVQLDEQVNKDL